MARFPFNDLHSFKDFVGFVRMCAPDSFPEREGAASSEQWSLTLAFEGLREGLALAEKEKGTRPVFESCRQLFEAAHKEYSSGNKKAGFMLLADAQTLLRKVPSQ